jgi:hypothetical protein
LIVSGLVGLILDFAKDGNHSAGLKQEYRHQIFIYKNQSIAIIIEAA